MSKIVVIGGGGYLGQRLVNNLIIDGHDVYVKVRNNANILIRNNKAKLIKESAEVNTVDIIINLAYPSGGKQYNTIADVNNIFKTIKEISTDGTRVILTSSLAVFGFDLDREQKNKKITRRRDYPYIEGKIELENLLLEFFDSDKVDILRLGNIWGPGCPNWTVNIANKIYFGQPVAKKDNIGYSNCTDVENVISYISFLIKNDCDREIQFHHLAEFSNIRWLYWFKKIEAKLGMAPVYQESDGRMKEDSRLKQLLKIVLGKSNSNLAQLLWNGRYSGSFLRSFISLLPQDIIFVLNKKLNPSISASKNEKVHYQVMGCKKQFKHIIDSRWKQKVDLEESWNNIEKWMYETGYLTK